MIHLLLRRALWRCEQCVLWMCWCVLLSVLLKHLPPLHRLLYTQHHHPNRVWHCRSQAAGVGWAGEREDGAGEQLQAGQLQQQRVEVRAPGPGWRVLGPGAGMIKTSAIIPPQHGTSPHTAQPTPCAMARQHCLSASAAQLRVKTLA